MATGLEKVSFHSKTKEGQCHRVLKLPHNCTYFTCYQGNAQNPSSRHQQYVNWELPDVQVGFRKGRGARDQMPTSSGSWKKQENSRKTSTYASLTTLKPLTVDHNKVWNILQEMGVSDHLTYLLWNLYARQEATVRTRHVTMDWFKIGEWGGQDCELSPCLFNLYA